MVSQHAVMGDHVLREEGLTVWVWCHELDVRRHYSVLQGQRGLDQAGDACGTFAVANVGFHRPDVDTFRPENVPNCRGLDRVANRGTSTMTLELFTIC